jgi:hypothetical protein
LTGFGWAAINAMVSPWFVRRHARRAGGRMLERHAAIAHRGQQGD